MYIADMHNDSLLTVSADCGLISKYNLSNSRPQLQFFAGFVPCDGRPPELRRHELMKLSNIYLWETERLGLANIKDVRELILATDEGRSAAMFTVEGGGGLFAESEELYTLYKTGLRILGPVWDTNELGCSCYEENDTGLTAAGKRLCLACDALGITLDVSHLSDRGFFDLLELTGSPIIATHSNFRDITPSKRNLTLDMAKAIAERGGVIGLNLYPAFLNESGTADITDIIRHIDYALEHLGDRVLGFGFDIDGTEGHYPKGFDEGSSMHDRLLEEIAGRYGEGTLRRLAGENVIDFLKGAL